MPLPVPDEEPAALDPLFCPELKPVPVPDPDDPGLEPALELAPPAAPAAPAAPPAPAPPAA